MIRLKNRINLIKKRGRMLHSNLPLNLTTKPNKIYYLTKNLKLIFSDAKVQLFSETAMFLPEKMQKTNIFLI